MAVLTQETKAKRVADAMATLTGEYMKEGRTSEAQAVLSAAVLLKGKTDSLSRLFDILTAD